MAAAEEPLDLDILAASLRADASDLGAFVEALADKLEEAMPGLVRVERPRRGLRGRGPVRRIVVEVGGTRLMLNREQGDVVSCNVGRTSGGIVLKREEVGLAEWTEALGRALSEQAGRSAQARQALERLLMQ
jgi:hypothetical protein